MEPVIFGHIRFSYLGRSDARLSRSGDDDQQRAAILYHPERMAQRFHLFERLCAPSLRWQTDPDFKLGIFASPEMPEPYQKRLATIAATIPQAEIVYDTAIHVTEAINNWITGHGSVHGRRTLHFRLDDDDALAVDHIATLRKCMDGVPDHTLITRPSGLLLADNGPQAELLAEFHPFIAIGLAIVNPAGHVSNPYQMSHIKRYRQVPSLMLPGSLAYIHAAHEQSDTVSAQHRIIRAAREEHDRQFARRPRRFREAVKARFGGKSPEHFLGIMKDMPRRAPDIPPVVEAPDPVCAAD